MYRADYLQIYKNCTFFENPDPQPQQLVTNKSTALFRKHSQLYFCPAAIKDIRI